MTSIFQAKIAKQLSVIGNKEKPLKSRVKAAESLIAILKKNKLETLRLKNNSRYYNEISETLKSLVEYLKTIIVRRRGLLAVMWDRDKLDRKIWAFENRELRPGEITKIERIHQKRINELERVDANEFVMHTNLLIATYEELGDFAKQL